MGGVFLFNFTKLVFWIGRTCFLTRNSFKKNVLLDGSTQRWLRIPLVWILYILQGHRRTKEQWRRGWQVWPALNLLRLLCGLSAPNEALFLLLLKLNTVFDSSLPKPQWSFLKSSLWRRDSLSHGNHICSGSCHWGAASTRGGGECSFLSAFAVCAKLHHVDLCSLQCFWNSVPSSSLPIYLEIAAKCFSSIRACSHAQAELVLGSDPRGSVCFGKGALPVASFLPVELEELHQTLHCCLLCLKSTLVVLCTSSPQETGPSHRVFFLLKTCWCSFSSCFKYYTAFPSLYLLFAPFCPNQNWPCFQLLAALCNLFPSSSFPVPFSWLPYKVLSYLCSTLCGVSFFLYCRLFVPETIKTTY